jgi:hypothetical protein
MRLRPLCRGGCILFSDQGKVKAVTPPLDVAGGIYCVNVQTANPRTNRQRMQLPITANQNSRGSSSRLTVRCQRPCPTRISPLRRALHTVQPHTNASRRVPMRMAHVGGGPCDVAAPSSFEGYASPLQSGIMALMITNSASGSVRKFNHLQETGNQTESSVGLTHTARDPAADCNGFAVRQ